MDETKITVYRQRLELVRADLQEALTGDSEDTDPVEPDSAIGRLTRQDAMQAQQMALELRRRNQIRLEQVHQALRRLDKGTYGACLRCEEPISEARLKMRPEAPVCIECAEGRRES